MDLSFYEKYAGLIAQGRGKEAGVALRAFITSFNGLSEKRKFTKKFLQQQRSSYH